MTQKRFTAATNGKLLCMLITIIIVIYVFSAFGRSASTSQEKTVSPAVDKAGESTLRIMLKCLCFHLSIFGQRDYDSVRIMH